jgi:broad specificity phosphatase PhoE
MAALIHLVRHAEVHNPQRLVYASLPGFGLSEAGIRQAQQVARYLGSQPVVAVWSSPLQRALETAAVIAERLRLPVRVEPSLGEWRMTEAWAGLRWDDLPTRHPGALEAYLEDPSRLDFASEGLEELAQRIAGVVEQAHTTHPEGDVVLVSHQDPIQAARLLLTGRELAGLHHGKPGHAGVVTLRKVGSWAEMAYWEPDEQHPRPPA